MIKKSLVLFFVASLSSTILANEIPALPVKTYKVEKKDLSTSKTYPTILKAAEQVDVLARVSGILKEKAFKEGDFVKKGDLLYKIEDDKYLANLNMKKANFVKAQKDYERAKNLIKSKSISPQVFDDYTFQYESSKASLEEAQIQYNYTKVTSPINGITSIKKQDLGTLVGTNASNSVLLTITNINPINVEFALGKDDINNYLKQIKNKETKVKLLVDNKAFEGNIDFVSSIIDSKTDTLLIRAKFENNNSELIVGNFAQVEISKLSLGDVFVIPENAVIRTAKSAIVMLVDENNTVKVRPVVVGDLIKEGLIIKAGLNENDEVIISNIAKLRPDMKVQIINKENKL